MYPSAIASWMNGMASWARSTTLHLARHKPISGTVLIFLRLRSASWRSTSTLVVVEMGSEGSAAQMQTASGLEQREQMVRWRSGIGFGERAHRVHAKSRNEA